MTIYKKMKQANVEGIDHHESDLYVPVTETTSALIKEYVFKMNVTTFINQKNGKPYYDIPFAYDPYWENKKCG